jgi:hypothetical protein
MDFPVRCECGRLVPVPETAAGATHPCECGRTLDVPSLSELKRQCGLPAYSPPANLLIPHMIDAGELPAPACLGCGAPGETTVEAVAECERAWETGGGRGWWLAFFVIGIWALVLRQASRGDTVGRNLYVSVPFRLCPRCRRPAPRTGLILFLRVLKFVVLAAGVGLAVLSLRAGFAVVGAGLLLWWAEARARRGAQATMKRLLRRVPVYAQLLREYPEAQVVWDERDGS